MRRLSSRSLFRRCAEFQCEVGATHGNDSQKSVYREVVAVPDAAEEPGDAIDARQTQFARNDHAMDEHAAAPLHHCAGQGHQVGHAGLDGVADEYVAGAEKIISAAQRHNWTAISIQRDWKQVFPDRN